MKTLQFLTTMFLVITFILQISSANCGGRFIKLENCTTTNRSLNLERCDLENDRFNMIQNIFKPLHVINV